MNNSQQIYRWGNSLAPGPGGRSWYRCRMVKVILCCDMLWDVLIRFDAVVCRALMVGRATSFTRAPRRTWYGRECKWTVMPNPTKTHEIWEERWYGWMSGESNQYCRGCCDRERVQTRRDVTDTTHYGQTPWARRNWKEAQLLRLHYGREWCSTKQVFVQGESCHNIVGIRISEQSQRDSYNWESEGNAALKCCNNTIKYIEKLNLSPKTTLKHHEPPTLWPLYIENHQGALSRVTGRGLNSKSAAFLDLQAQKLSIVDLCVFFTSDGLSHSKLKSPIKFV